MHLLPGVLAVSIDHFQRAIQARPFRIAGLYETLERGQLVFPKALVISEPSLQFEERFRFKPVSRLSPDFPILDKTCVGQNAKMLRNGCPAYRKVSADDGDRHFLVDKQFQQLAAGRIGDRLKDVVFSRMEPPS